MPQSSAALTTNEIIEEAQARKVQETSEKPELAESTAFIKAATQLLGAGGQLDSVGARLEHVKQQASTVGSTLEAGRL